MTRRGDHRTHSGQFAPGHYRAARLTPEKVLEIRERYASGETQGSLARRFGVSLSQIGKIVRRESWTQFFSPPTDPRAIAEANRRRYEQRAQGPYPDYEAEAAAGRQSVDDTVIARMENEVLNDPYIQKLKAELQSPQANAVDLYMADRKARQASINAAMEMLKQPPPAESVSTTPSNSAGSEAHHDNSQTTGAASAETPSPIPPLDPPDEGPDQQ